MLSNHPNCLGGNGPSASSDLIGDVDGPASATDNAVARFDGTTGKLIQNSVVTIADTTGDIAGASSLTSPAATNLTLGLGTGGTALTLASSTLAATFAGSVAAAGGAGSATDFAFVGANTAYATFDKATAGPAGNAYGIRIGKNGYSSLTIGLNKNTVSGDIPSYAAYIGLYGSDKDLAFADNLDSTPVTRMIIKSGGTVSISNTTAGSSGAGALVVAGGISAGAASYFGGAVTVGGAINAFAGAGINYGGNANNFVYASGSEVYAGANTAQKTYIGGVEKFTLSSSAATFAGAVNVAPAGAVDAVVSLQSASGQAVGAHWKETSIADRGWLGYAAGSSNLVYRSAGYNSATGTLRLTIDGSTGAATFAGTVIAPAATASLAPLRIPHGTAPTSPTNGDMWTTTAGLFIRINGATVGPLS